jgi:flagellar biosynthesis/type III secretory pathway chaperone
MMNAVANPDLDRLAQALADERQALLDNDINALMRSTQEKIGALKMLESGIIEDREGRLAELVEINRANGALLARRRREVNWALRHLGRTESSPAYDARGQASQSPVTREWAVA